MEYKKASTPVVLTREQCDWFMETLASKHADRIGAHEVARLRAGLGCHWWDREAGEFLFTGPFMGRTSDSSYYFFVDAELLQVTDIGGWMGPCRLSFRKFPAGLEGRRGEFEARLVAVLQKAGLAYTLSDAPWPALTAEEQALWRPEFASDDHWTVDDL